MFGRSISTILVLAQISSFLLHSVFLTGLVNTGIALVSAKPCTAYWLEFKDGVQDYSTATECPYTLKHSDTVFPATSAPANDNDTVCYYVPHNDQCPHEGDESYFKEKLERSLKEPTLRLQ
ncbi:hypothetical protein BCR37DRAFT_383426 [Protomyces lactucae-debilis]|uniref:Uncharacterized protein n=1 Tax=Protomyces lactucae-debilis TaxID=2754530 RepID=A0A1Y2EXM4_PROLT|nr:uncharacterized protein BCR37DRAFT_383426 [Protomyces lactucae-debilis]ORY76349.1 hypothetical protein BCR37DRAFT_383426 [Protomyces lactucae-debilis]